MNSENPETTLSAEIEALFSDLPPRIQDRLWQIIMDYGIPPGSERPENVDSKWKSDLLITRASVVQDHRRDGTAFWRLYLESGSRDSGSRTRKRVYIGTEGGPELREAIILLREAYFSHVGEEIGLGPCGDQPELLRKMKRALDECMRDQERDCYE